MKTKFLFFLLSLFSIVASATPRYVIEEKKLEAGTKDQIVSVRLEGNVDFTGIEAKFRASDGITITKVNRGAVLKQRDDDDEYIYSIDWDQPTLKAMVFTFAQKVLDNGEVFQIKVDVAEGVTSGTIELYDCVGADIAGKGTDLENATMSYSNEPVSTDPGYSITLTELQAKQNDQVVPVMLVNNVDFTGIEAKFKASEGITITKVNRGAVLKQRDDDDEYIYSIDWDQPTLKAMVFTFAQKVLDNGEVFQIKVNVEDVKSGTIELYDCVGADIDGKGTDLENVVATFTIIGSTGIDNVENNVENAVVYDLAGRRVNANARGLLIKGGKKYVVK